MKIMQRLKVATRFVFGQSQLYSSWGYDNPGEPTARRQRTDYRGNFFRCVNIRADQISSALADAKVVRVIDQDEVEEVEYDHPWAQRLRRPVPRDNPEDFWKWVSLSRDLLGHSHAVIAGFDKVMGARIPSGFLPIYSEFGDLNPIPNKKGGIDGWQYLRNDGNKQRFDPKEVLALRRTSPYNPYKTMSLIQAAMYELDVDLFMKQYRRDSVKDGGITSPVIGTDEAMNKNQRDQLSQDFKSYMGQRGKNKVLALSHGMKPIKLNMDARDLQYIEGNIQNSNDLRFITGIPEALYSKDANRAVLEGAERVMVQYTIQPEVNMLCKQLTTEFEKIYGAEDGKLMVMPPDLTPINEELQIKKRESYLRTGQRTVDEYRQQDGKDEYPDGIGGVPLVSFSQTPLKEVVTVNDQFKTEKAVKKKANREVDRDYEWRVIEKHRSREEKKTAASVRLMFDKLESICLENIENQRMVRDKEGLTIEQVLNLIEANHTVEQQLSDDVIRLIREGFKRGLINAQAEGLSFEITEQAVRELLRKIEVANQNISKTTIEQLSESLSEGVKHGESLDELTDRVSAYFVNAKRKRTRTIAQTLTTSGFEGGQLIAFKRAGAKGKSWLSQRDGHVREDHTHADATQNRVELSKPFMVGGFPLMHPGDPSAPASQIVFCRCSMLPVMKRGE